MKNARMPATPAESDGRDAGQRSTNAPENLIATGQLIGVDAFVGRLGCTRQALDDEIAARRIFFVEHDGSRYFPAFYAETERYDRRRIEKVSEAMGNLSGGAKLLFFLTRRGSLAGATPLDALAAGMFAKVLDVAEAFADR